jgi:hypothetical protein
MNKAIRIFNFAAIFGALLISGYLTIAMFWQPSLDTGAIHLGAAMGALASARRWISEL